MTKGEVQLSPLLMTNYGPCPVRNLKMMVFSDFLEVFEVATLALETSS